MTSDELLLKVEERLNKTGNPAFPPEETLTAILALGNERNAEREANRQKDEEIQSLKNKLQACDGDRLEAVFRQRNAENSAREQGWIAHELGKFVKDVANGIYEGQEMAAAKRVFDLNGSSLRKKRLNAYNFDSLDEARREYQTALDGKPYAEAAFLEWLFESALRESVTQP